MCTLCTADGTKERIAAYHAKFRDASASAPGRGNHIGVPNLIDAASHDVSVRRHEFYFLEDCFNLCGATCSPMRPVSMLLRR